MADFSTPALFANGLPILNQSLIDKQYQNRRTNELTANNSDIRDQLYNAGWGQKSDAVKVLTGAGNFGIVSAPEGMGGTGYKTTTGQNASDQSFIDAAKAAGIDPTQYMRQEVVGMGNKQNILDRNKLYNALQTAGKDLYSVTNAVEGAKRGDQALHATVKYKADGSGNLVPVSNEQTGQPDVQYFNATRYAKDPGIMGCLAPFLMLAPAVGGILGGAGGLFGSGAMPAAAGGVGGELVGGLPGVIAGGTGTMAGETLNILSGLPTGLTADIATGLSPSIDFQTGLPNNPNAPGYQIDPEGPAQIGSQCVGIRGEQSLLTQAKNALDTAKQAKGLYDAGKALFGGLPVGCAAGCGSGGGTGRLDTQASFLNQLKPSTKSAGLKTVNKEAEENVKPEYFDENQKTDGYAEAGSVTTERNNQGSLSDAIKELNALYCKNNSVCWEKINKPKFKRCTTPEFLHATKQSTVSNPLKQLRQGLRVNPLASGGLPHKYAAAAPKGHKPEFITGMTGYYACGAGTGQSDDIPAMLHDGDYVMDAETVSALGDGSSKAGREVLEGFREKIPHKKEGGSNPVPAKIADGEYVFPEAFVTALGGGDNKRGAEILDGLRTKLRAHKRGAPLDKIPPKAKDPIQYIKTESK